jgi:hypothetical protein
MNYKVKLAEAVYMFDFRVGDKVVITEEITGRPNAFKKEYIVFIPQGAKGKISTISEISGKAEIEFAIDQNTHRSHITVPFEKLELQRKRRTVKNKEVVKEEIKKEYPKTDKKELPKTSGDLCKMFLDGKTEKYLTVKQTEWLIKLLEKEHRHITNAKGITNDGVNSYKIQLLSGSSRLMVVE